MKTKDTGWLGIAAAIAALAVAMTCTAAPSVQQWPKIMNTPDGRVMVYEPQVETFEDERLTARTAVSVQIYPDSPLVFGVAWFDSQVNVNRSAGTVDVVKTRVTQVKFPGDVDETERFGEMVAAAMTEWDLRMSLDEALASVAQTEAEQGFQDALNNEPPAIIFSERPAMLVVLNGEPRMTQVEGTTLMRVVNTPFTVVLDLPTGTYYVKAGEYWMETQDLYGTWTIASRVPAAAIDISEGNEDVRATGMVATASSGSIATIPAIIVATEPTELVVMDGRPEYKTIIGTSLLYVSNTDSDLFLDIDTQQMYLLIAGRWFTSPQFEGPWRFIQPDRLPSTFARIPPESAMGHVLANVAGTEQAATSVAATYLPQTAAVRRSEASVTVVYDGSPRFDPIVGTTMFYAVNSPHHVIRVGGWYYVCDNAVWFMSRSPLGPWVVCDAVPRIIYTIPPSSPVYHVRYVRVFYSTPDIVYFGYFPGYMGTYVYRGAVVYGTGYWHRGWYSTVYFPRPVTWGFAFRYSRWSGWNLGICYRWSSSFRVTRVNYVYGGWWGCGGFWMHNRPRPCRDRIVVVDRCDRDRGRRFDRCRRDSERLPTINVYDRRPDVVVRNDDTRQPDTRTPRTAVNDRSPRGRQNSNIDRAGIRREADNRFDAPEATRNPDVTARPSRRETASSGRNRAQAGDTGSPARETIRTTEATDSRARGRNRSTISNSAVTQGNPVPRIIERATEAAQPSPVSQPVIVPEAPRRSETRRAAGPAT
ncbi:MAG TPA: hypothetical protein VLH60_02205, partial [Sedimentisphaerales bacterium]|nr:hypothetical protein [Sedimentisphaerales bacterium]